MQYQHEEDWLETNIHNHQDDTSTVASTTAAAVTATMNQGTFEVENAEEKRSSTPTTEAESAFSMEASMSRIDALAESLSDLTRKRVGAGAGQYRAKKRPSIGSTCSGAGTSMCSGSSLAIDELASIDSSFLAATSIDSFSGIDLGISRLSLGGGDEGGSTTSARLTNGMWSLQDMEPWVCSICTFENEPVFLSCEICGQSKAASSRLHHLNRQSAAAPSQFDDEQERERTRLLQEQRMRELQELQRAAAEPPVPAVVEAKKSSGRRKKSKRKSGSSSRDSGSIPSTIEHSPRGSGKRKSSSRSQQATNTAPQTMEDASLQNVFDFAPAIHHHNKGMRAKPDPNDSVATERTFDMDQSEYTHMGQSHMDQSSYGLGQSSRQWNSSRRSGGHQSHTRSKAYRHTWFEGMDEISDEISV